MKVFHAVKGTLMVALLSVLSTSVFALQVAGIGGIAKTKTGAVKKMIVEGATLKQVADAAQQMGFEVSVS